jgi:ferric-dicitrate binding protein FerR (iron transport regulator)
MNDQVPWAKIAKYLAGECSSREKGKIVRWVNDNPSRKKLMEEVKIIWNFSGNTKNKESEEWIDVDTEWEKLRSEINTLTSSCSNRELLHERSEERIPRRLLDFTSALSFLQGVALIMMIALIIATGVFLLEPLDLVLEQGPVEREVTTGRGEKATLRLSDGTKVKLNSESQLNFPNSFHGQNQRAVRLSGEAYFNVESDSVKKFTVYTSGASIDVYGTSFNVQARSGRDEVQVAVEEGDVAVRPKKVNKFPGKRVNLSSGEVGSITSKSTLVKNNIDNIEEYIGWTKGFLIFNDKVLPKVVMQLRRQYGLDFVIQDNSLKSMRLTAKLKGGSPKEVLDVISASLGIRYKIEKNVVYLIPKKSKYDK